MRIVLVLIFFGFFLALAHKRQDGPTCNVIEKSNKHTLLDKKRECTLEERRAKGYP